MALSSPGSWSYSAGASPPSGLTPAEQAQWYQEQQAAQIQAYLQQLTGYQQQELQNATGPNSAAAVQGLANTGSLANTNAAGANAANLAGINNAASMQQLEKQIAAQSGMATAAQQAEMARLQESIKADTAKQASGQTFAAGESAAERAARLAELEKSQSGAQTLESMRQLGAKTLQEGAQSWQSGESAADRTARLGEISATGAEQKSLAQQQAASQMEQLQKQIAANQGMATEAQTAEMDRLKAQLGTQKELQSGAQTFQAGESAAERQARLAELAQTQSGAKDLATHQTELEKGLEDARFARAKEQQASSNVAIEQLMQKAGLFGGADTAGAGAAPGGTAQDEKAASDAAFASAKDKIGLANRSSLNELDEMVSARGINNSGLKAQLQSNVLAGGLGQIGEATRQQAGATLARKQQVADRDVAAALTKRGQNVGLTQSMAGLYRASAGGGVY